MEYIIGFAAVAAIYFLFYLIDAISKRKYDYKKHIEECNVLRNENADLRLKVDWYKSEIQQYSNNADYFATSFLSSAIFSDTLMGELLSQGLHTSEQAKRIVAALKDSMQLKAVHDLSFNVQGTSGNTYTTTLNSCTCPDFIHRGIPCKHMYRVAVELGQLCALSNNFDRETYIKFLTEKAEYEQKIDREYAIVTQKKQTFPFVAKLIEDAEYKVAEAFAYALKIKKHPGLVTAKKVESYYSKKIAPLVYENKTLKNQLEYLESTFPWLEEFEQLPPEVGYHIAQDTVTTSSEYEYHSHWISADEWQRLNPSERYQIALDRYKKREKTDWEIGREYERYVGYCYEKKGFRVQYFGATQKLEDLGRDVIASNEHVTYIIQCKYWNEHRTVREKHIFQLYGTLIMYRLEHPDENNVKGLFVTSCSLSKEARQVAEYLDILVAEHYPHKPEYPIIKCNLSRAGERIYHLPFDQQYDRVVIEPEKGEFYAMTIAEAENAGFRRAKAWLGSSSEL